MKLTQEQKRGCAVNYAVNHMGLALSTTVEAKRLLISALLMDDAQHKQWCIERALAVLDVNLSTLRKILKKEGQDWKESVEP